ncbi:hypothetical protein SLS58_010494 [Diplodia intermedia]|uniref:Proline racemase n=1 Tax=Diplodia intermedia TaxID=856260 RepID=A0ABR3T5N1_9PEZI
MHFSRTITVVGVHAAGEVGDVIVGGVLDVPGKTMYEKMMHFWTKADSLRRLLLNEPRGRASMCTNLVLPPCDPAADAGFLIMESDEWAPMSGSNTICTATVLLETGMVAMVEPETRLALDTAAGLVAVTARCEAGKCRSVAFDNVPSFVFALDYEVDVPGIGVVRVDLAWGGMVFAVVDAASVDLRVVDARGKELVAVGERIKKAVRNAIEPVHPENPGIRGVSNVEFTAPLEQNAKGDGKQAVNTAVVSPGRLDRSPCGTGTCARMAILHARGLLEVGEPFRHLSITGSEFTGHIRGTTKVGDYDAILPTVEGSAWITSFKQVVLDPSDPFPEGFRVGDAWHVTS